MAKTDKLIHERYDVRGMTCAACEAAVTRAVSKLDGVEKAEVSLMTNSMNVTYDKSKLGPSKIEEAVSKAGYEASVQKKDKEAAGRKEEKSVFEEQAESMKFRLKVSVPFMLALMYFSMGSMLGLPLPSWMQGAEGSGNFALTQLLLTTPVLIVNRVFFSRGFKSLFHGSPNMDSLIALGSAASYAYGIFALYRIIHGLGFGDREVVETYRSQLYFESASMILTLITLGKYLELRSKMKTTSSIRALMDLQPDTAVVVVDGKEKEVPIDEVKVGDIISIKPGSRIPLDGVVTEGQTSVDESVISGESIPVTKGVGDKVTGATMNNTGAILFRTTAVGEDTTLSKIIQLVEDANSTKAPIQSLADKIAGIFVPVVILISLLTFAGWMLAGYSFEFALRLAISVLVISCPCALGLATPVVVMAATGKGAENGLLIKSAGALQELGQVKTMVFDKTGTLTEGHPKVTDIVLFDGEEDPREFLAMAASLEKNSEQPLAEAVVKAAEEEGLDSYPVLSFQSLPGRGVEGRIQTAVHDDLSVESCSLLAGNLALMEEKGVDALQGQQEAARLAEEGKTPMYFARDGKLVAVVAAADRLKETSRAAVARLKKKGIQTIMLTGDNRKTARAVAAEAGVDDYFAEVLPQEKEARIREKQAQAEEGHKLAMVGDGINDAPALARADVGIAVGAGTDVAMDSADIVLVRSDLQDVAAAYELSEASMKKIHQNYFWAFFYNVICIPIAAGLLYPSRGITLNPMIAAACMSFSSIFVVLNALSLRAFKPSRPVVERAGEGSSSSIHWEAAARKAGKAEAEGKEGEEKKEASPVEGKKRPVKEKEREEKMEKTLRIKGMMCDNCRKHVEKALNSIEGVEAEVDLEQGTARVRADRPVSDEQFREAVAEAGYEVTAVEG